MEKTNKGVLSFFFVLFSSVVAAQSAATDTYEIISDNMRKVTKKMDTTVRYRLYDTHGSVVTINTQVRLSFVRNRLVAAQRMPESNSRQENYFYYFNNEQLIMVQYTEKDSGDVYICSLPACKFMSNDLSLADALITAFSRIFQ